MLTESETRRVAFARHVLGLGVNQSRLPEPKSSASILAFQVHTLLDCYERPDDATLQNVAPRAPKLYADGLRTGARSEFKSDSKPPLQWQLPAAQSLSSC